MHSICFLYRIGKKRKTYYGKYVVSSISDDHEGLDIEVITNLHIALNSIRKIDGLPWIKRKSIKVGIISYSDHYMTYTSTRERSMFDFYYDHGSFYLNGSLLDNVL